MKLLLLLFLMASMDVYAHGDHSAPGAIPPAPNGGALGEAEHLHKDSHKKHDHNEAEEMEIFFEAKLRKNILTLYPLDFIHTKNSVFKPMNVSTFSKTKILVKDPRRKKSVKFKLEPSGDKWLLKLEKSRARRLIVEIESTFQKARYKAKVQVEKK